MYSILLVCVRGDVRSCNNYVSADITSEEKKSAFDLSFNPPISINVFPVVASSKFSKRGLKESWTRGAICFLPLAFDQNFQFREYYSRLPDQLSTFFGIPDNSRRTRRKGINSSGGTV